MLARLLFLALTFAVVTPAGATVGCDDLLRTLEDARGARVGSLQLRRRLIAAFESNRDQLMLAIIAEQARRPAADLETLLRAALDRAERHARRVNGGDGSSRIRM